MLGYGIKQIISLHKLYTFSQSAEQVRKVDFVVVRGFTEFFRKLPGRLHVHSYEKLINGCDLRRDFLIGLLLHR